MKKIAVMHANTSTRETCEGVDHLTQLSHLHKRTPQQEFWKPDKPQLCDGAGTSPGVQIPVTFPCRGGREVLSTLNFHCDCYTIGKKLR